MAEGQADFRCCHRMPCVSIPSSPGYMIVAAEEVSPTSLFAKFHLPGLSRYRAGKARFPFLPKISARTPTIGCLAVRLSKVLAKRPLCSATSMHAVLSFQLFHHLNADVDRYSSRPQPLLQGAVGHGKPSNRPQSVPGWIRCAPSSSHGFGRIYAATSGSFAAIAVRIFSARYFITSLHRA